jgi:hypothetical protein
MASPCPGGIQIRRKFVTVAESFPHEVGHVLKVLGQVYRNDARTKEAGMSDHERLQYHQEHSSALLQKLRVWLQAQVAERLVEPNSSLGQAIAYTEKRWKALTRFLVEPGAPLDNNICERALKKAILHRKNSLFFKTENGARVGDLYMSLIHTCEFARVNAFDYLTALLRNADAVADSPERWLPWTYQEALPLS